MECFSQITTAYRVAFNDFHMEFRFSQFCKALADIPAARNDNTPVGLVRAAKCRYNFWNIAACCKEKNFIIDLDNGIAIRNDCMITAKDGDYARFNFFWQAFYQMA